MGKNHALFVYPDINSFLQVYSMDASRPECGFQCLLKREDEIECFTDHWDDHFYALKNNRDNSDYVVSSRTTKLLFVRLCIVLFASIVTRVVVCCLR